MPVREFTEAGGRQWRVWDVRPEAVEPKTRDEVYLARMFHTGWLVFETATEDEKRRLAPIPEGWSDLPDEELDALRRRSELIPPRKLKRQRDARGAEAAREQERAVQRVQELATLPAAARSYLSSEERPDVTDLGVVRAFRYPGGRFWAVGVFRYPEDGGPAVLRFTSGARHVDLHDWPKDWADARPEELVDLLRSAPRPPAPKPSADAPRRRWDELHP